MTRCLICSGAVPDLPVLDPARPTCSTRCGELARRAALSRLVEELTR